VQDEQHGNAEGGDEAEREHGHGSGGDGARCCHECDESSEGDGQYEIGHAEELPEDKGAAMGRSGEFVGHEGGSDTDGDVSPAGGLGEEIGQDLISCQGYEGESCDSPAVDEGYGLRVEAEKEVSELAGAEVPDGEDGDRKENGEEDGERRASWSGDEKMERGGGEGESEPEGGEPGYEAGIACAGHCGSPWGRAAVSWLAVCMTPVHSCGPSCSWSRCWSRCQRGRAWWSWFFPAGESWKRHWRRSSPRFRSIHPWRLRGSRARLSEVLSMARIWPSCFWLMGPASSSA